MKEIFCGKKKFQESINFYWSTRVAQIGLFTVVKNMSETIMTVVYFKKASKSANVGLELF